MPHDALVCESCHLALPVSAASAGAPVACPRCGTVATLDVFPAAFRTREDDGDAALLVDSEDASCFFHGERRAVVSCGCCGKFLCSLCDVSLLDEHYCTGCLESLQANPNAGSRFQSEYQRWEVLAARLTLPSLLIPIFFSPAALILAVMGWRAPRGPVGHPRRRAGFVIAFQSVLTGLMCMWLIFFVLYLAGVVE